MSGYCENCRAMRERAETLQEQLVRLRSTAFGHDLIPPASWRLSKAEATIIKALCSKPAVTREQLTAAMETERHDWDADPKIFDVWVCKIRRKLSPFGVEIVTRWGVGYSLRDDQREAVKAACDGGNPCVGPALDRPASKFGRGTRDRLIKHLAGHPRTSVEGLAIALGLNTPNVRSAVYRLVEDGVADRARALRGRGTQPPYLYWLKESQAA